MHEIVDSEIVIHCYGLSLGDMFGHSIKNTYTFTLENEIAPDGSNKIYVTVFNNTNGKIALEKTPMDDHYINDGGALILQEEESDGLCGIDFKINYLGNETYRFCADYFDLRIWENGKDGESVSHFKKTSEIKPTCTENGYSVYTCSLCGYSKTADYVSAKGHSFGEWYETKEPTYREEGEERRDCANCEHYEIRTVAALEYLPGDVNGDEKTDIFDANLVRKFAAKGVDFDERQLASADVNGDGTVNIFDANFIRRYAVKLIVNFTAEKQKMPCSF